MDVLETLSKELERKRNFITKEDLLLDEKIRFLYLRVCQLFTYDSRYHYISVLGHKGKKLQKEILNKQFDLKNVTDFRGVCSSISSAFAIIVEELLGVKVDLQMGDHVWAKFTSCYGQIKTDATMGDLTRAKMGVATRGYQLLENKEQRMEFEQQIYQMDIIINYIKYVYPSIIMMLLKGGNRENAVMELNIEDRLRDQDEREKFIYDYLVEQEKYEIEVMEQWIAKNPYHPLSIEYLAKIINIVAKKALYKEKSDQFLIEKVLRVQKIFNENYKVTNFEDAKFIIDYMFEKILFFNENIEGICLFDNTDKENWEFINIYPIHFIKQETLYFALRKEKERWMFHSISYEEVKSLVKGYKGMNKHLLLK